MKEVPQSKLKEEIINTDVLVVGAGTGGMMVAISAADAGARVVLCEKGHAKRSGGIRGGNDHFMCYIPEIHGPAVRETLLRSPFGDMASDTDIIMKIWDLSYEVLQMWESWGVDMKREGHYEFTGHGWPGTTGKMGEPGKTNSTWLHFSDYRLSDKLEKQVRERNIRIMNRVMVTELLKDSHGRAVGAIGVSTREPVLYIFQAKSIVYNTGGVCASRLYPSPHVKDYTMAEPETGDGDMMAYRAGADLQDVETTHRHVALVFGPFWGQGSWVGVIRDSEGKPIAPPYLTKPDADLGDMSAPNVDAHDRVWATGKGPVWMDTRELTEEDEQYMRWGFDSEAMQPFTAWLEREKIDIRKSRFEFSPRQPSTHMKTRVDINCRTAVEGLYSTIKGGLSRSATSGYIAGKAAAEYARGVKPADMEGYRDKIRQVKQRYEEILSREGTQFADWREVQWAIWQIMHWYAMPARRSESTLMAGYNQLLKIREKARRILKADNQHDLYHCLEILNLLDIAELVLLAVNERKESRGQARRIDYPFVNPMLSSKMLLISQKDGKPSFRWEEPRRPSQRDKT